MKVLIENWGPVGKCEYDLDKAVLVTYGDNNIGKSYAMQVIYIILKNIIKTGRQHLTGRYFYYMNEYRDLNADLQSFLMRFVENKQGSEREITDLVRKQVVSQLQYELADTIVSSLENSFGTYMQIVKKEPKIRLVISDEKSFTFCPAEKKSHWT